MISKRILVVDDSDADRASLRIGFAQCGLPVALSFAQDAETALTSLRAASDVGRPHMMLVDVHMPGRSGLELLASVKKDSHLREIPVWMLSGSRDSRDVRAAYRGHACGFLRKPQDAEGLRRLTELMARLCCEALESSAEARS